MADSSPSLDGDWPAQAADAIVRVVEQIRDRTTVKVQTAAKVVVYGLALAILGTVVGVLLAITSVRVLVIVLPDAAFGQEHLFGRSHVWAAHLLTGLVFLVAGTAIGRRRHPKPAEDHH